MIPFLGISFGDVLFWVIRLGLLVIAIILIRKPFVTIYQGSVAVIVMFGKYRRIMSPGLNLRIPFLEIVYEVVSIQNRSVELEFQATTADQANVHFKAMLLYAVLDQKESTIVNVAYKFDSHQSFMTALIRTVEGHIRSFVATKKQSEVLILRREIIIYAKEHLDVTLEEWGFHLIDVQINDITFDQIIMDSMAKVVASSNLKSAAENEGQALLITKTKQAEAEGNAIKISAEAEKQAAQLRGQGVALFREEVAKGMSLAAREMTGAHLDPAVILFSIWTEAIKNFAEHGKGNFIFLDGSTEGMNRNVQQFLAISKGINQVDSDFPSNLPSTHFKKSGGK